MYWKQYGTNVYNVGSFSPKKESNIWDSLITILWNLNQGWQLLTDHDNKKINLIW